MDSDPATLTRKWLLRKERLANLHQQPSRSPQEQAELQSLEQEVPKLKQQVDALW